MVYHVEKEVLLYAVPKKSPDGTQTVRFPSKLMQRTVDLRACSGLSASNKSVILVIDELDDLIFAFVESPDEIIPDNLWILFFFSASLLSGFSSNSLVLLIIAEALISSS